MERIPQTETGGPEDAAIAAKEAISIDTRGPSKPPVGATTSAPVSDGLVSCKFDSEQPQPTSGTQSPRTESAGYAIRERSIKNASAANSQVLESTPEADGFERHSSCRKDLLDSPLEDKKHATEQTDKTELRRQARESQTAKDAPASEFQGVSWNSGKGRWQARTGPGRTASLGFFPTEEEAAQAYDRAAFRLWGKQAQLNFPSAVGSYRKKRGLAAYDSDPEISAESGGGAAAGLPKLDTGVIVLKSSWCSYRKQKKDLIKKVYCTASTDVDEEIVPRARIDDKERKKPARRKRSRLVPPHSRSSRYRGVYWEPKGSKWYSSISSNHKQIHLGSFNTEEEAAHAFDQEAIRLRGPGTFTNFPPEDYLASQGHMEYAHRGKAQQKRHPPVSRRRLAEKVEQSESSEGEGKVDNDNEETERSWVRPEKDDQAANALLSLGSSLSSRNGKAKQAPALLNRPTPPRSIEPPVTLRGQKRKRGGPTVGIVPRSEGIGRARSKFTGVYQQSRGNGWFASICVDKAMRYLGTFASEEEAARAFDQEAIRLRGTGIELNLPHEAEKFMQKLKEEEAATGGPIRLGPAPLVSAGPDFEGHIPRQPLTARLSGESSDESPRIPRRPRSLERAIVSRSRRRRNVRSRSSTPDLDDFDEDAEISEEERETERGAQGFQGAVQRLPVWVGRRPRTLPNKLLRTEQRKQVAEVDAAAAFSEAIGSTTLPADAKNSLSYLSLLAPTMNNLPSFRPGFSTPTPIQTASAFSGATPLNSATPQLARPAASYAKSGVLPSLGLVSPPAWPQSLGFPGSFPAAPAFSSAATHVAFQQQAFSTPPLPPLGLPNGVLSPPIGSLIPGTPDAINLALIGGPQAAPLGQLMSHVSGFPSLRESHRPSALGSIQPQLPNSALGRMPETSPGVMRPAALHASFQPPIGLPAQMGVSFGFPASQLQIGAANGIQRAAGSPGSDFKQSDSLQDPATSTRGSRHKPQGQIGFVARAGDQQTASSALERGQHSSAKPGIGVT